MVDREYNVRVGEGQMQMNIMHAGEGDCKNKLQNIGLPICNMDKMSEALNPLLKKATRYTSWRKNNNEAVVECNKVLAQWNWGKRMLDFVKRRQTRPKGSRWKIQIQRSGDKVDEELTTFFLQQKTQRKGFRVSAIDESRSSQGVVGRIDRC